MIFYYCYNTARLVAKTVTQCKFWVKPEFLLPLPLIQASLNTKTHYKRGGLLEFIEAQLINYPRRCDHHQTATQRQKP